MLFLLATPEYNNVQSNTTKVRVHLRSGIAEIFEQHQDLMGKIDNNIVEIETNFENKLEKIWFVLQDAVFIVSNQKDTDSAFESEGTGVYVYAKRVKEINSSVSIEELSKQYEEKVNLFEKEKQSLVDQNIDITDQTKEEWDKAFDLFGKFDVDQGVNDLITSINYLRNTDNCNGKVGTVGYCLGGKLSYLLSCRSNADCNVSYYGVGIEGLLDESSKIKKPYLSHIAEKDSFVPKDNQQKILANLSGNDNCDLFIYPDQDHAFARVGGEHFNENSANLANSRTKTFFEKHLF